MTRLVTLGLAFLAIALCGVIALDFTRDRHKEADQLSAENVHQTPMAVPFGTPRQLRPWVSAILGRPLFEPSRRPPAGAARPGKSGSGFPRLTGIIIMPHQREAIFAAPGQPRSIVLTVGSRLNGVLIKAIDAGGVVIVDAAGARVIHPSFDTAAPRSAAPSTPALVDLPPMSVTPTAPGKSPFASIRGLFGRPLGLAVHPDQTPPNGGAGGTAPGLPALAPTQGQP